MYEQLKEPIVPEYQAYLDHLAEYTTDKGSLYIYDCQDTKGLLDFMNEKRQGWFHINNKIAINDELKKPEFQHEKD